MRIACVLWILFIGLVKSFDDDINTSWNRFDRAASKAPPTPKSPPGKAPPTGKPKNSSAPTGPPLPSIVSRHMKLAPIFNALYIDIELSNGKIDSADVVAGLWNLKDKSVLNKLVSLDTKQLSTVLNTLDEKIKTVPDTKILDLDGIKVAFDTIKGVSEDSRRKLKRASDEDVIPAYLTKIKFEPFGKLSEDLGEEFLLAFEEFAQLDTYDDGMKWDLCRMFITFWKFSKVASFVAAIRQSSEETLDTFSEGFTVASDIYSNAAQYQEFSNFLSNATTALSSIRRNINAIDKIEMKETANLLKGTIADIHQPNTNPSFMTDALDSYHNLSLILKESKDSWISKVIGGPTDDEAFKNLFKTFEEFSTEYPKIKGIRSSLLNISYFSQASVIFDLIKEVETFESVSGINQVIESLLSCLVIPADPKEITADKLRAFSDNWKIFLAKFPDIQNPLESLKDNLFLDEMSVYWPIVQDLSNQTDFDDWKARGEPQEIIGLFTTETKRYLTALIQDRVFTQAAEGLNHASYDMKKTQEWFHKFNLIYPECDVLFNFDVNSINRLPEAISRMKTQKPIEKLKPFLKVISEVKSSLEAFSKINSSENTTSESPKNLKKLKISNPQNLLTVSHAMRSLEKINEINNLDKELTTVIQQGDVVLAAIRNLSDSTKKEMLEKIWKDFPVIKGDMIRLKRKILDATEVIKPQDPEKQLEDVGKVYESIRKFSFNERIDLRPLIRSMELFDAPGFPEMQKSLEKLEEPYFGNWWEAHKSFQKAQKALRELQMDFEQFFGPKVVERERDEQSEYILSWMWTLSTIIFFEFCTLMALCAINKCLGFDELVKELDGIKPDDEEVSE